MVSKALEEGDGFFLASLLEIQVVDVEALAACLDALLKGLLPATLVLLYLL